MKLETDLIRKHRRTILPRAAAVARLSVPLALLGLCLPLNGCGKTGQPRAASPQATSLIPVDELLRNVARTYRQGQRYADQATIELSYRDGSERMSDKADIAVEFMRPNRLTLRAYKTNIVCDGQRFQAIVRDEGTRDLDGQVVDRPAPAQLTISDLTSDKLLAEQLGNAVLTGDHDRLPPQLELLLGQGDWHLLSDPSAKSRLIGVESVEGSECLRVEIKTDRGMYVLWIDATYYVLRKMLFPREALIPELAQATRLKDVQLVAHFHNAAIDFPGRGPRGRFQAPDNARRVRYFVPPPRPLPSDWFGKKPGNFSLQSLGGPPITPTSLAGHSAVLLWFHDHPACEQSLRQLNAVYTQLQESDPESRPKVSLYGVCTEPSSVGDDRIRSLAERWEIQLPLARDLNAHGRDLFQFQGSPALLVLDAQGVVQIVEIGVNPNLEQELPKILERLEKGENVAGEVLARDTEERSRYEQELAIASGEALRPSDGSKPIPIAPEAPPKRLVASKRWSTTALSNPGNIIVAPLRSPDATAQLFVLAEGNTLVELALNGKEAGRRVLPIPADKRAANARMLRLPDGRERWAITGPEMSDILLLDEDLQQLGSVPLDQGPQVAEGERQPREFAWVEWQGKQQWGLLARQRGPKGVELFEVDGKPRPTDELRGYADARWLAVAPPDLPPGTNASWRVWIGDRQGWPGLVARGGSSAGMKVAPSDVPGWSLLRVFVASFPTETASKVAAIAVNADSRVALVAFDEQFRQRWNYPLAALPNDAALEPVQSALLGVEREPFWVLAAPDGTVHFISADGSFSDYMAVGAPITGLAALRYDGAALVLVSTSQGVTAWSFERPR